MIFDQNILGFPILTVMVFFPLLVGVGLLFLKDSKTIARVAALGAAVTLVISLIALAAYLASPEATRTGAASYGLQEYSAWLPDLGIGYHVGVDTVSILLIVLTTLLTLISILVSWDPIQKRVKEYYFMMLLLEVGMLGVFVSLDFFLFYVFWEVMLVPMALLIGIWGSSNRVYAAVKFFLYTLAGSLLMLVAIIVEYFQHTPHTLDIVALQQLGPNDPTSMQNWVFLAFALAFAVKVPMFPFHTWLPDAHVEAPTAGSIILAGVLLKMGGYGFIRFAIPITPEGALNFAPLIIGLSVVGVLYGAMVSLVQPDLKKLIAYSSVSHMGFVTLGLFTALLLPVSGKVDGTQGIDGAIFVMLSHGVLTGGLFLCVGVIYNRLHSRKIADMGGFAKPMPLFAALFLIMMLGSVGLPGLSGFIGEFLAMQGAFRADWLVGALTALVVIFAAWYLFWMFQRVVFGKTPTHIAKFKDLDWKESSSLVVLAALSLLMGVFPGPILEMIKPFSLTLLHTTATAAKHMPEAAGLLGAFFK